MKITDMCKQLGLKKEEIIKLSGVPAYIVDLYDNEGLHMMNAIYLFRLSLVLGCENGSGYALIDKKQKQMAINEVKDNFIFELAQTEVEDCISTEYMGDYDSLYKFCESKIEKDSFRQTVEYRYPMLLGIMQYCDIQEKVKEKIKELLYDKFNI